MEWHSALRCRWFGYSTRAAIAAFFTRLADETRQLPSVRHAGVASALPLSGQDAGSALSIFGQTKAVSELPSVRWQVAGQGYFTAMGIPILRGRDYTPDDLKRPHVSIVSEAVERQFFPGQSAVGQRIYCGLPSENHTDWHEVIGVVGDVRHRRLDMAPEPRVYDLLGQHADESAFLVVRSNESAVLSQVRSIVRRLDPELAIYQVSTLEEMTARSVAPRRFLVGLISGAALLALIIAAVGVYGVMAYSVARRRHEFGVRLALGAAPGDLIQLVARQGILLALAGSLAGGACAAFLSPILASQVYGAGSAHVGALAAGAALFVLYGRGRQLSAGSARRTRRSARHASRCVNAAMLLSRSLSVFLGIGNWELGVGSWELTAASLLSNRRSFPHRDSGRPEHVVTDAVALTDDAHDLAFLFGRRRHRRDCFVQRWIEWLIGRSDEGHAQALELRDELTADKLDALKQRIVRRRGLSRGLDGAIEVVEHFEKFRDHFPPDAFDVL